MSTILENIEDFLQQVEEVTAMKDKVVRGGEIKVKMKCPEGYKYNSQTHNCERMTAMEQRVRERAAMKGAKIRSRNVFGQELALRKRAKSIKKGETRNIYDGLKRA